MQDENLTLEKAINSAKATEMATSHQKFLKGESEVSRVQARRGRQRADKTDVSSGDKKAQTHKECYKCGKTPSHKREDCPANKVTCHKCKKKGHFAKVCRSKAVNVVEEENRENTAFLGSVSSDSGSKDWNVKLSVNKESEILFKIDTGADVSVIPETLYERNQQWGTVTETSRVLLGPGKRELVVKGMISYELSKNAKTTRQDLYIVQGLNEPLLGKPAIEALQLIVRVENVTEPDLYTKERVEQKFPSLFKGLGELKGEFKITLKPDAKPFAIYTPRRVPLPLMGKVKSELEKMEAMGVISKVEQPTEWCAGMVVVPKKDGEVRICVDLTKLNENVMRETHPLPKIDHLLAQVGDSKFFSKVDANSGFWQEKLSPESRPLTTFITPFGGIGLIECLLGLSRHRNTLRRR